MRAACGRCDDSHAVLIELAWDSIHEYTLSVTARPAAATLHLDGDLTFVVRALEAQ
jgi:hypothetical protein